MALLTLNDKPIVLKGSGGSPGYKITFPATAMNWDKTDSLDLLFADGTTDSHTDYSGLSNQTFENVVGILCKGISYWVPTMTLSVGIVAQVIPSAQGAASFQITKAPNASITPFANATNMFWWPLADTTISAIEMYNTD